MAKTINYAGNVHLAQYVAAAYVLQGAGAMPQGISIAYAFACRMVHARAYGNYYKAHTENFPLMGGPWFDAIQLCSTVANPHYARLVAYCKATKPATWQKWAVVAKEQHLY